MKTLFATLLATSIGLASFAQGPGHQPTHIKNHPRVNQVDKRIDNQEKRITEERKEGDLTKQQAQQDRKNLSTINQEKKDMRKLDKGHLTTKDQKALNQQLNQNSKKIGQ
jgi:predicted  nucleic acid-binding Zn-ribbon protein